MTHSMRWHLEINLGLAGSWPPPLFLCSDTVLAMDKGKKPYRFGTRYGNRDQATERGRPRPLMKAATLFRWGGFNMRAPDLAQAAEAAKGPPRALKPGWAHLWRDGQSDDTMCQGSKASMQVRRWGGVGAAQGRGGGPRGGEASERVASATQHGTHAAPSHCWPLRPVTPPLQFLVENMFVIDLNWALQQLAEQQEARAADGSLPPEQRAAAAALAAVARDSWVELRRFPRGRFDLALCTQAAGSAVQRLVRRLGLALQTRVPKLMQHYKKAQKERLIFWQQR